MTTPGTAYLLALPASGIAPAINAITSVAPGDWFAPVAGRPFNITIDGTFAAVAQVERSFDSGATGHVVISDAVRQSLPASFSLTETEVGVLYRTNVIGFTSGTVNSRLSA